MSLSVKTRRDHNKDYPNLPVLWRLGGDVLPNEAFIRTLLKGALANSDSTPNSEMNGQSAWIFQTPKRQPDPAKETYESDYISAAEAGLREIMEDCQTESKNREMIQIANLNYGRVTRELAHLKGLNLKVLQMPRVLEAMIKRETDRDKKWHLKFLRDSFLLWLTQKRSDSKNPNVLYYPYHRILEYDTGRKAHENHINNFLNDNARGVIEERLTKSGLFTDKKGSSGSCVLLT